MGKVGEGKVYRCRLTCRGFSQLHRNLPGVCLVVVASYETARPPLTQHHRLMAHQVTERSKGWDLVLVTERRIRLRSARDGLRVTGCHAGGERAYLVLSQGGTWGAMYNVLW